MVVSTKTLAASAMLLLASAAAIAGQPDDPAASTPPSGPWFVSPGSVPLGSYDLRGHASAPGPRAHAGLDLRADPDAFRQQGDGDVIANIVVPRQPLLDYDDGKVNRASQQVTDDLFGSDPGTDAPLGSDRSSNNDECRAGAVCSSTGGGSGASLSSLLGR